MNDTNQGNALMPNELLPSQSTKHSTDPVWCDSSYLQLPEFLDKLKRWIKRHPKYFYLWTQSTTLFPNGQVALGGPTAITAMRNRITSGATSHEVDLAHPCMGTGPSTFASVAASASTTPTLTADEKTEYRIAPQYIEAIDMEAEQAILGMIVDLQRRHAVAEHSNGSGRRAAQLLMEWATTRISSAQLDNVHSLLEQHVTMGLSSATHEALSEWKTKYDQLCQCLPPQNRPAGSDLAMRYGRACTRLGREFNTRLSVQLQVKTAQNNAEKTLDVIHEVISDMEALTTNESRCEAASGGHTMVTDKKTANPLTALELRKIRDDMEEMKALMVSGAQRPRTKSDPVKKKKTFSPPTAWNPKMRLCRNHAAGLCSGRHLDRFCPYLKSQGTTTISYGADMMAGEEDADAGMNDGFIGHSLQTSRHEIPHAFFLLNTGAHAA